MAGGGFQSWIGRSPLTDVRALGSSFLFHALLLLAASLAVLSRAGRDDGDRALALRGDLGPVDNRAAYEDGGGGAGELGGRLRPDELRIAADGPSATARAGQDAADALLSEVLPAPSAADRADRSRPGPIDLGVGLLPGPSTGGGGGSGGGSGGGVGQGVGPGTEFFGARETAASFGYVIDCSGSMANRNAHSVAKRELLASLGQLPPDARFGVVFYNERPAPFLDPAGNPKLMAASAANKERLATKLASMPPDGGTNHVSALRAGLAMKPEVIFFLTDADLMSLREAEQLLAESKGTRIQAVEFGIGPDSGASVPLRSLSEGSGGSYRYIDVMSFPRAGR